MTDPTAESLTDFVAGLQAAIADLRRKGDVVELLTAAESAVAEIERRAGACRNDAEREALKAAKRISFNAAADCWPGWSVADSAADPQVLTRALALAQRSATLVDKLGLDHLQQGTAIWLVGAFELALGNYAETYRAFSQAREHYLTGNAPGLVMLTEGYLALLSEVAGKHVPAATENLDHVSAKIAAGNFEDGAEWIEQLRTAQKVFT